MLTVFLSLIAVANAHSGHPNLSQVCTKDVKPCKTPLANGTVEMVGRDPLKDCKFFFLCSDSIAKRPPKLGEFETLFETHHTSGGGKVKAKDMFFDNVEFKNMTLAEQKELKRELIRSKKGDIMTFRKDESNMTFSEGGSKFFGSRTDDIDVKLVDSPDIDGDELNITNGEVIFFEESAEFKVDGRKISATTNRRGEDDGYHRTGFADAETGEACFMQGDAILECEISGLHFEMLFTGSAGVHITTTNATITAASTDDGVVSAGSVVGVLVGALALVCFLVWGILSCRKGKTINPFNCVSRLLSSETGYTSV